MKFGIDGGCGEILIGTGQDCPRLLDVFENGRGLRYRGVRSLGGNGKGDNGKKGETAGERSITTGVRAIGRRRKVHIVIESKIVYAWPDKRENVLPIE